VKGIGALLGAELRRFFSRRVMRGAFAFGIALSTLVLVIITVRSAEVTSTQRSQSTICGPSITLAPGSVPSDGSQGPPNCITQSTNALVHHDRRARIHDNYSETVKGVGIAAIFIAFVIGASFVGAEFGAGSLSTQLIFEPRRVRVVVVKAIAVGIGLALMTIALLLYIGILQWAASELRGVVNGLDGSWFAARAGDIGRVSAAVGLAGIAAYAVTVVARRTVAAVAILLIVGWASAIIGSFKAWRWAARYNPATALIELVADETRRAGNDVLLTVRSAAVWSCLWAIVLSAIAAVIFSRREVR
jgi:hypothetical protein